jgi:hypothetical protein
MGKGRAVGTKNLYYFKYQLVLPNGEIKLYKSQNQINDEYSNISRTKLNKIVNHPCLVQDLPFRVIKLKTPLPVFDKYYDDDEERFKYRAIVYDTKGNQVEREQGLTDIK